MEGQTATSSLINHSIIPDNGTIRFSISSASTGTCKAQISISRVDFKSVTGDFDIETQRLPSDFFELYLFQNIAAKGTISVNIPILSIKAKNSINVTLEPLFDRVEARNPTSGDISKFEITDSSSINNIKAGTKIVGIVESEIRLDNTNSNLSDFISLSPRFLNYELGFKVSKQLFRPTDNFQKLELRIKSGY